MVNIYADDTIYRYTSNILDDQNMTADLSSGIDLVIQ